MWKLAQLDKLDNSKLFKLEFLHKWTLNLLTYLGASKNGNFWHTFLIWCVPCVVENSSHFELLHRTNLFKFLKGAVKKTGVFGNLNYSKTCALLVFILIYDIEHVVFISWHLEKVCRTNLFKIPNVAVEKNHVFRTLMDSIFGLLLCVFLIWYKEAMVWISNHFKKVSNSNLF